MNNEYVKMIIYKMEEDFNNKEKIKKDFEMLYNLSFSKINKVKISYFIKSEVSNSILMKLFFYQNKNDFIDYIYETIEDNFSSSEEERLENERCLYETIKYLL